VRSLRAQATRLSPSAKNRYSYLDLKTVIANVRASVRENANESESGNVNSNASERNANQRETKSN
jgi:hypothetical protein